MRKEVQRAREDFEAVVKEIDGGLTHFHWKKSVIPVPHFTDTVSLDDVFRPLCAFLTRLFIRHQDGPIIKTNRAASKPPNSGPAVFHPLRIPSERAASSAKGENRAHRTEAERDGSRTKEPPQPTNTCKVTEGSEGQKGIGLEFQSGRMIDSVGDSTTVWSSLELDGNCGHSQKG